MAETATYLLAITVIIAIYVCSTIIVIISTLRKRKNNNHITLPQAIISTEKQQPVLTIKQLSQLNKKILFSFILEISLLIVVSFLLLQLDTLIHKTLYDYGLQFSYEWAKPYWNITTLIWITLYTVVFIKTFPIILMFIGYRKSIIKPIKQTFTEVLSIPKKEEQKQQPKIEKVKCNICNNKVTPELLNNKKTCPNCRSIIEDE